MYFPSNNWFVVRCNMVGTWQVESQKGCFFIPCPSQYKARQVRHYLMYWLTNSHFYRLAALSPFVRLLIQKKIAFDEFYRQVKIIHFAAKEEF